MKRVSVIFIAGFAVLAAASCNKFLDINTNPNQAVATTPELIIPQALVGTANNLNQFNTYGQQQVGYTANAGGYGGFGTSISYNYSSSDYAGLWGPTATNAGSAAGSYDNLQDYQAILDKTDMQLPNYSYFNGAARIMKALTYELLVDAYNSVPYSDALQGSAKLTPAYTDPTVIYKDLVDELDKAIATINTGLGTTGGAAAMGASDILFGGDMAKWKQLANTIKLRLILFGTGKVTFSNTTFTADGFLTTDALINPVFSRDKASTQNPKWNSWAFGNTGSDANKAWIPTTFILSFYNGVKLEDSGRGKAIYYQFPNTGTNQLGYENTSIPKSPSGSFWLPSDNRDGSSAGNTTGVLKGPDAGYPVITAGESYFLQAEAVLKGLITGDDAALFKSGIVASFKYLYTLPDNKTVVGDPAGDEAQYEMDNAGSPLVNYALATSTAKKEEAIITQKYIALNFVNSEAAWNDYRRTHYPTISGTSATSTFASTVSESTRPDRLPTRILYPVSEGQYNPANVPKGISPFTSTIFWAL